MNFVSKAYHSHYANKTDKSEASASSAMKLGKYDLAKSIIKVKQEKLGIDSSNIAGVKDKRDKNLRLYRATGFKFKQFKDQAKAHNITILKAQKYIDQNLKAINKQWDSILLPQNNSKPKKVRFGDVTKVTFGEHAPIAPKKQVTKGSPPHSKANQSDQAQASPLDKLLGKQRQLQSKIDGCRDNTDFRGERAAKMYENELKIVNQQLSALSKQQQRSRGTSIASTHTTRGTTASRAQKITELSNHIAQLKREKADCENSGYKNADREARLVESKIKQVESELEALLNA